MLVSEVGGIGMKTLNEVGWKMGPKEVVGCGIGKAYFGPSILWNASDFAHSEENTKT